MPLKETPETALDQVRHAFASEGITMIEVPGSVSGSIAATLRSLGWPKPSIERGYLTVEQFRNQVPEEVVYSETKQPEPQRNHSAMGNMAAALSTYAGRNTQYGNSYHKFGVVMMAMFPHGICLKTVEDFNRYGIFFMMMSKMLRYTTNPHQGHLDSIHDNGVYSFMLEELDAIAQGLPVDNARRPLIDRDFCQHVWNDGMCLACLMPQPK